MCIIIYKPPGIDAPSFARLKECAEANPDGWGMMWAEEGKLNAMKGLLPWDFSGDLLALTKSVPVAFHFRTASVGKITIEACHPHLVSESYGFMHNGNLFHFQNSEENFTDSQLFADFMKKNGLKVTRSDIEDYFRRNYSKGIFMDMTGYVDIINEQAGMWEYGCWYSNGGIKNYIGYGYSGAYPYSAVDVRHKGGILSVQGFANQEKWRKCKTCEGWFYELETENCEDCEAYHALFRF